MTIDNDTYLIPDDSTRILFYQPDSAFYANNENVLYRNWSGSDKFNNPKTGKARTLSGFKKKDFNYMYFMMNSAFKKQPLTFSKVEYEVYKDHTFFVDWV